MRWVWRWERGWERQQLCCTGVTAGSTETGEQLDPASPVCRSGAHPAHVQSTSLYPIAPSCGLADTCRGVWTQVLPLLRKGCVLAPGPQSQAQQWWKLDPGFWIAHPLLFSSPQTMCLGLHPHCGSSRRQTRFSCSLSYCLFSHWY